MSEPLSLDARRAILDKELLRYTKNGYNVISRSDSTAQLVKPKKLNLLLILLFLVMSLIALGLLFLLLYLIWYWLFMHDETIYLDVNEHGKITRR